MRTLLGGHITFMKLATLIFLICSGSAAFGATKHAERLEDAATVVDEVMAAPYQGIPRDLLNRNCVVVVPGLKKAAFIFGARYGKGYVTCQQAEGGWSAPATVSKYAPKKIS